MGNFISFRQLDGSTCPSPSMMIPSPKSMKGSTDNKLSTHKIVGCRQLLMDEPIHNWGVSGDLAKDIKSFMFIECLPFYHPSPRIWSELRSCTLETLNNTHPQLSFVPKLGLSKDQQGTLVGLGRKRKEESPSQEGPANMWAVWQLAKGAEYGVQWSTFPGLSSGRGVSLVLSCPRDLAAVG